MSTHKKGFTRPQTYYSARRGYYRTPMVRKYQRYQAKKAVQNKYSRFQEKVNNVEQKSQDIINAAYVTPAATNGALVLCNAIGQGVGSNAHVGRRYTMTSFQYRMVAGSGLSIRIMVVYDRSPNGVTPVITDILNADTFVSPQNLSNVDRFVVVSDKIYQTALDGGGTQTIGHCYLKMSLDTNCVNTGSTIADISTGALWLFACQSGGPASTINIHQRLRFTDA